MSPWNIKGGRRHGLLFSNQSLILKVLPTPRASPLENVGGKEKNNNKKLAKVPIYFVRFPYFRLQSLSGVRFDLSSVTSSILVPSATRFNFQDHVTKRNDGLWGRECSSRSWSCATEKRSKVSSRVYNKGIKHEIRAMGTRSSRECLFLVSLFFSWCRNWGMHRG